MPKKKRHLTKLAKTGTALFQEPWLEQYAALCHRRDPVEGYQVLLITSRGTKRWVIPKGGPMKGKSRSQVAEREAWEEAGVKGKASKKPIGRYSYVKRLDNGQAAPCLVEVFTLKVESTAEAFKEHGQRQLAWVQLADVGQLVEEPELRGLFAKLNDRLMKTTKQHDS